MGQSTAALMFGMAVLWLIYQFALRQVRCLYCGKVNAHEEHCPYNGKGMTGGRM